MRVVQKTMDLNLEIDDLLSSGRKSVPLVAEAAGELTEADIGLLSVNRHTPAANITRLQRRHHSLARLLASGKTPRECMAVTGYSASRISILQSDPMFQELVQFYSANVDEIAQDLTESLTGLALDAVEELRERVETEPEKLTPGQLIEMTKLGADRTGHGPSTTSNQNMNVTVNYADRLAAARKRIEDMKTIEGTAVEVEKESST